MRETWIFVEAEQCLVRGNEVVRLTPKAAAVLACLLDRAGTIVSREELLQAVWPGLHVTPDLVREYVFDLRRALGDDARTPRHIETVRGKGFRLLGGVAAATTGPVVARAGADRGGPETGARGLELTGTAYKAVTALRCGLTDGPVPTGRAEAEAVHQLLESRLLRAQAITARHDGTIVQRLEDGFLCLFGAARTHEDHARRAVLAALELVRIPAEAEREAGLAASIGIGSGPVLVGALPDAGASQLYVADDETIRTAKRLHRLSGPGEILLGEATFRSLESEIVAEARTDAETGGTVYRLCGLTGPIAGVPRRSIATGWPFGGRDLERAILTERLDRARRGEPHVVSITGAAGIGKSRLVEEFRRTLGEGTTVLGCRCLPYETSTPYFPLRDLVRGAAGVRDAGQAARAFSTADAAASGVEDRLEALLEVVDPPATEAAASPERPRLRRIDAFRALDELVLAAAEERPVLMVLEDVHWIDATTREWLAEFVATLRKAPVLVIVTSREPVDLPWPPGAPVTQLALPALTAAESEPVVQAILHDREADRELIADIVERSAGNPFFLTELALAARDTAGGDDRGTVPDSVQSVILARIDRLEGLAASILRIGSVIGGEIPRALLANVCALDEETVEAVVAGLVLGGFLSRSRQGEEPAYRFRHALLEETVYQSLPLASLRRVHARVVEVLESHLPHVAAAHPEIAARHHEKGSQPEKAVAHLQRAARRAYDRSAYVEASQYAQKALSLLKSLSDRAAREAAELDILLILAPALAASLGYGADALMPVYARAEALCRDREDEADWFKVNVGFWNYRWVRGELDEGRRVALRLLAHAERHPRYLPRARAALGEILFHIGALRDALDQLEAGIRAYGNAAQRPRAAQFPHVACLCYAAWTSWHLGRPRAARRRAKEAVRLAAVLDHPFTSALCLALLSEFHQFRLDVGSCLREAQRAIEVSGDNGFPFWEATAMVNAGWAVAEGGAFARGRQLMRAGIDRFRETGARVQMSCWTGMLADIHVRAGRYGEGHALLDEAFGWVEATGEMHYLSELHRLRAEALKGEGGGARLEAAVEAYRTALATADRQGAVMRALRAATGLAALLKARNRAEDARSVLDAWCSRVQAGTGESDVETARALRQSL